MSIAILQKLIPTSTISFEYDQIDDEMKVKARKTIDELAQLITLLVKNIGQNLDVCDLIIFSV